VYSCRANSALFPRPCTPLHTRDACRKVRRKNETIARGGVYYDELCAVRTRNDTLSRFADGVPWTSFSPNVSYNIEETVPGYFNGMVLQRKYVEKLEMNDNSLKLPVIINLTIVWTIVFICLSKGNVYTATPQGFLTGRPVDVNSGGCEFLIERFKRNPRNK